MVKWFNSLKGYGVIKPFDGGFNVYVQIETVELCGLTELKEGQTVDFDIVSDSRTGKVFAVNLSIPLNTQEASIAGRVAFLSGGHRNRRSNLILN
jgi:CspA family cold shock protein